MKAGKFLKPVEYGKEERRERTHPVKFKEI